jgi:hypothetical protein
MAEKPLIVFKSEPALWDMLAEVNPDGTSAKPFDMRRWDLTDDRIYRLSWGRYATGDGSHEGPRIRAPQAPSPSLARLLKKQWWDWVPDEDKVSFVNKATGEVLTFLYLGVEFAPWAPGWGFLQLGKQIASPVEG